MWQHFVTVMGRTGRSGGLGMRPESQALMLQSWNGDVWGSTWTSGGGGYVCWSELVVNLEDCEKQLLCFYNAEQLVAMLLLLSHVSRSWRRWGVARYEQPDIRRTKCNIWLYVLILKQTETWQRQRFLGKDSRRNSRKHLHYVTVLSGLRSVLLLLLQLLLLWLWSVPVIWIKRVGDGHSPQRFPKYKVRQLERPAPQP